MITLTCIAKIIAKAEYKAIVLSELTKLIAPTQLEDGCINYDLHTDNANDAVFIFHENWVSGSHLDKHLESSHVKQCFAVIGDMLTAVEISRLTKVTG